nr:MAG TPA: hypothetical protein [Caudoviricetes sp.]
MTFSKILFHDLCYSFLLLALFQRGYQIVLVLPTLACKHQLTAYGLIVSQRPSIILTASLQSL